MSVAINSSPAGALNTTNCWKRKGSDDEDSRRYDVKRAKYSWYVTLESESSEPTDEDEESIYTIQGNETEFARDTSDTSTHTWISSCSDSDGGSDEVQVEYEIDSRSENENPFVNFCSSSDAEDIIEVKFISFGNSDGQADDSADSMSSVDSDIKKADFRTCVQCKNPNNNPLFRYCEKCYQLKKFYFPRGRPRRKPRSQKVQKVSTKLSSRGSSIKTTTSSVTSTQELVEMDSGIASSQCDSISGSSQELILPDSQTSDLTIFNLQNSDTSTASIATVTSAESQTITKTVESQSSDASAALMTTVTSGDSQTSTQTIESQRSDVSMMTVSLVASPSVSQPLEKDGNDSGTASKDCESDLSDGWFNDASTANNQIDEEGAALLALVKKQLANRPKGGQPIVETCQICMERPMDGCFPHPSFVHMCYCYKCASKVWKTNGHRCPICNVKVGKVLKALVMLNKKVTKVNREVKINGLPRRRTRRRGWK